MPKIAISYRRTDSDVTGRIFDRLVQRYGRNSIFRDIDDIPFGIDFRKVVNDALQGTDALIAIVGPNWRGARTFGAARINEANDPVRIEVEAAIQRDIPLIPVLIGGAVMPKPTELPNTLRDFAFRNAANVDSGRNFETDVERLMSSMDRLFRERGLEIGAEQRQAAPRTREEGSTAIGKARTRRYSQSKTSPRHFLQGRPIRGLLRAVRWRDEQILSAAQFRPRRRGRRSSF
jgi:TIR domain